MSNSAGSKKSLFSLSNLIWLLIILGAVFLALQFIGKKESPEAPLVAEKPNRTNTKNDPGNFSFTEPPLGLYTKMTKSNDEYFMEGMNQYKLKQYTNAMEIWENLPAASTIRPDTLNYYIGGIYFARKDYDKAHRYFQKVLARPGTQLTNDANWFMAVCHHKMRNTYLAVQYLEDVDHPLKDHLWRELDSILKKQ